MKSDVEILKEVKQLLTVAQCRDGVYAVDERGDTVDPNSPSACKWCLVGAIAKVAGVSVDEAWRVDFMTEIQNEVARLRTSVVALNDTRPLAATLQVLDTVIALRGSSVEDGTDVHIVRGYN